MEYFWIVLPKMGGFLLLVLIGFLASRLGVVKKEALTSISGFLIKIVLPALVISLIWENHTTMFTLFRYGRIVLWQIGAYLLLALTGFLVSRVFKLPGSVRNVFCGCMVGGNFGFLVIPLIMALFAETGGDKYIPICSVVDTIVVWTLGLLLFFHRKFLHFVVRAKNIPPFRWDIMRAQNAAMINLEDIKPFFEFVIINVIILNQKVMHV